MRDITAEALEALTGDRADDRLLVVPWLAGEPTRDEPLPVEAWSISWSRSSQIQAQVDLTVADPDGDLAPWAVDDVLGAGGPRVSCTLRLAGVDEEVALGQYRITDVAPSQAWLSVRQARSVNALPDGTVETVWADVPPRWVSGGTVAVQAEDETVQVDLAEFLSPQSVTYRSSIVAEIEHLLDGILPVAVADGVVDRGVPASIAYEGGRIDALGSLVRALGAAYRVTPDAQLEVYVPSPVPVWTAAPGEDGVLIDFARSYSAREFVNCVVVEGKSSDDGVPLIGVARETEGPLRVDGPHGLVPARRQSDILDTQKKVDDAAKTYLAQAISDRAIVLPVTCLPNPALEVGDVVRVETPVGALEGPIDTMRLSGSTQGVNPMELGIVVPFERMQTIGAALRRGERA